LNNRPIGIFDSGLGGLTVLKALKKALPNEMFIYLGDTARVPYGDKSKEKINQYSIQISKWLINQKEVQVDKIKLLYVGRIRKEKGIYSLLEIIKNNKIDLSLSIVGAEQNFSNQIVQNNVHVYKIENNEQNLIKFYDDHNIFVLPSYTEGHPMTLLEALSRLRPVVIFKDIEHVIGNKKGIFIADRNPASFFKTINHIKENYRNIQHQMRENRLPTKDEFLKVFNKLISNLS
jgi:glycosyltransferase involved in cell wall biosynthesis